MRVLEIGCGWGGFACHAVRLGIHVHAVTISRAQHAFVVDRIAREKLDAFAHVELRDYRDLRGQYDAIVSIEMFEAVGEPFWPRYFATLRHWRMAFESRVDAVRAQGFDETFIRTWRLYFGYCEAGFDEGRTDVTHFVVSQAD